MWCVSGSHLVNFWAIWSVGWNKTHAAPDIRYILPVARTCIFAVFWANKLTNSIVAIRLVGSKTGERSWKFCMYVAVCNYGEKDWISGRPTKQMQNFNHTLNSVLCNNLQSVEHPCTVHYVPESKLWCKCCLFGDHLKTKTFKEHLKINQDLYKFIGITTMEVTWYRYVIVFKLFW